MKWTFLFLIKLVTLFIIYVDIIGSSLPPVTTVYIHLYMGVVAGPLRVT